jgi:hypothetical protein
MRSEGIQLASCFFPFLGIEWSARDMEMLLREVPGLRRRLDEKGKGRQWFGFFAHRHARVREGMRPTAGAT